MTVDKLARALWRLDCARADKDEQREGRVPPIWADPWDERGGGIRQRALYERDAVFILRVLEEGA